jgi:cellulose synthase/poly-beta-1,6-N-acetylglucosamine synthase-like glycosyltransferase
VSGAVVSRVEPQVLLIGLGSDVVTDVISPLVAAGLRVHLGGPVELQRQQGWSLVIAAPSIPGMGSQELLAALRGSGSAPSPGLLVVGTRDELATSGTAIAARPNEPGLHIQGLAQPFAPEQLVARVQAMLCLGQWDQAPDTPPGPAPLQSQPLDLIDEDAFQAQVAAARQDVAAGLVPGDSFVAAVTLDELIHFRDRLPLASVMQIWRHLAALAQLDGLAGEVLALGGQGDLLLLLPATTRHEAAARLNTLSQRIATHRFALQGQLTQYTPALGFASVRRSADAPEAVANARAAAAQSALHLDMQVALYRPALKEPPQRKREPSAFGRWLLAKRTHHALLIQYGLTMILGLGLPFVVYWVLGSNGLDISRAVYLFVVVSLALTAISIWAEGFLALRRIDPPAEPAAPYPPASAVIAAYLPNEAPIIEDTIRAFLRVKYPAPLQVILAYNTPKDMPEVEERLQQIAREDSRFVPMRVRASTSKAQNVNAALPYVTGEFTAVFDADHQPDPDSFRRAWRWMSHGADVIQGHCFIRNGGESWVAKMVAVEFEQIYAVSHPGRARLHGFGIFGGSNGYWRTPLLRELRMHGFMLTEDIDSSLRAVLRGQRIVSDPYLVSRELAPETLQALTKQRLRWAQGWLQISLKWVMPALRSKNLSLRQKLGMLQLLAWREVYPWVSMQILPLIAYWAVEAGSLSAIEWFLPLFVVTSLFTLGTGPGQVYFTYRLSDPQIRKHGSWFWFYVFTSTLFYAGLKNAWNRIAHLKEAMGETVWVVTTRSKAKK